jgi:hypothetical protein
MKRGLNLDFDGRKSGSIPRCTNTDPCWNQQPPRFANSGGFGTSANFQEVVNEIQVTDRENIRPVFKLPLDPSSMGFFRTPYGSVPPAVREFMR